MSKRLTVRGVSEEVHRRLQRLGRARNESLNAIVLRILEDAVGIEARRRRPLRYATWSAADLVEFDEGLAGQRVIDESLWR